MSAAPISLAVNGGIAVITLNLPHKKNAMDLVLYKRLSAMVREVDGREDVFCTVITGKGDFFSAGADVKAVRELPAQGGDDSVRSASLRRLTEGNADLARSLYQHRKILVAALNGPAIGLSAGILGWFDFIYAVESAYILTPFSTLSLVAEGGASITFPRRMGIAKANEALIMGKRLGAQELAATGFVNKVFPQSSADVFIKSVLEYLRDTFEDLDTEACLITKNLIKASLPDGDAANIRELFAGADRFASGKPQIEFAKIAAKQKRHKL